MEEALIVAGWTPVSWTGAGDIAFTRPGKATIGIANNEGIYIQVHITTGAVADAATALARVLEASGLNVKLASGSSTNVDGVHVIVGKKPMQ